MGRTLCRRSSCNPYTYKDRDKILLQIGYNSYGDYLASDLWRKIRSGQLSKKRYCFRCGAQAEQVHHHYYTLANLSGLTRNGLLSICSVCHELLEFNEDGTKRPLHLVKKKTRALKKQLKNYHGGQ